MLPLLLLLLILFCFARGFATCVFGLCICEAWLPSADAPLLELLRFGHQNLQALADGSAQGDVHHRPGSPGYGLRLRAVLGLAPKVLLPSLFLLPRCLLFADASTESFSSNPPRARPGNTQGRQAMPTRQAERHAAAVPPPAPTWPSQVFRFVKGGRRSGEGWL